jgi:hypothetical protein
MNETTQQNQDPSLQTVELPKDGIDILRPLFQQGIRVRIPDGISVSELLVDVLGVDAEYVRRRITTVFLDGSVVDDMDTARLHAGSFLALSAAMPGLVGATMRKGGYYAAMRGAITLEAGQEIEDPTGQWVEATVKLFNLLIDEIGPAVLAHGVALPFEAAARFLGNQAQRPPAEAPEVWLRILAP